MRADKWLWATRFFKTRSQAAHDCAAHKVKRAGDPIKASTSLKIGDRLEIPSLDGTHKRSIEIAELIDKRVKASLAAAAFIDHTPPEVLADAERRRIANREARANRKLGDQGRLTKKKRRDWEDNSFF
ncbi:MAG: RNA-binding S4 domain-containing protein [Verrucomicrobiaceae bacterium]